MTPTGPLQLLNNNSLERQPPATAPTETKSVSGAVANLPRPAPVATDSDRFDWIDNGAIITHDQPGIAIYLNGYGQACIRQEARGYDEEDPFIVVNLESLPAVIAALQDLLPAHEGEAGQQPRDTTAAQRQRRYRERHRNGGA